MHFTSGTVRRFYVYRSVNRTQELSCLLLFGLLLGSSLTDTLDTTVCSKKEKASLLLETANDFIAMVKDMHTTCNDDDPHPSCKNKEKSSSYLETASNLIVEAKKSCSNDRQVSKYKVVCYFSSWAYYRKGDGKFEISHIDPNLCTHIIYAFASLNDNRIESKDPHLDLSDRPGSLNGYKEFNALKQRNPKLKTLLGVGGWSMGSAPFSHMASDLANRTIFVRSVVSFLKKYGFDGLDCDWEYPGSNGGRPQDKNNFVVLLQELKAALQPQGLLLTAAVSSAKFMIDTGYDIPAISKELDMIHLMTYDFHASWQPVTGINAPLYAAKDASPEDKRRNVDYAVNYWLNGGAPKEKLVMGLALYGRSFTLVNASENGILSLAAGPGTRGPWSGPGSLAFNEICVNLTRNHWASVWDADAHAPYCYKGDQWVGYDDQRSINIKVDYLIEKGLAGAMMWSIDQDDFRGICFGKKWYLLSTIIDKLMA